MSMDVSSGAVRPLVDAALLETRPFRKLFEDMNIGNELPEVDEFKFTISFHRFVPTPEAESGASAFAASAVKAGVTILAPTLLIRPDAAALPSGDMLSVPQALARRWGATYFALKALELRASEQNMSVRLLPDLRVDCAAGGPPLMKETVAWLKQFSSSEGYESIKTLVKAMETNSEELNKNWEAIFESDAARAQLIEVLREAAIASRGLICTGEPLD